MKWIKKGLIFCPDKNHEWMQTHAQVPFADKNNNIVRIYFGTRDSFNRTVTTYVDLAADNPKNILFKSDHYVLGLGETGQFDDCGAMPSWIVTKNNNKYLFYTGWNKGGTIPYKLAIGLAVSNDGGNSYKRIYQGPIMDRSIYDPIWCGQPSVMIENGKWKMWYLSSTKMKLVNGIPEPYYHVKYAESLDGMTWNRTGVVCIDYDEFTEAIGRPCVFKKAGIYRMFFSFRNLHNYRVDRTNSYRLGYAESKDGVNWVRMDNEVGIERSETGWDSEMMEYCSIYEHNNKLYMLYNGNGFGRSGFGYAVLEED